MLHVYDPSLEAVYVLEGSSFFQRDFLYLVLHLDDRVVGLLELGMQLLVLLPHELQIRYQCLSFLLEHLHVVQTLIVLGDELPLLPLQLRVEILNISLPYLLSLLHLVNIHLEVVSLHLKLGILTPQPIQLL